MKRKKGVALIFLYRLTLYTIVMINNLVLFLTISKTQVKPWKILLFFITTIPIIFVVDPYYIILDPIYFLCFSLFIRPNKPLSNHVFYSFLTATITDFTSRLVGFVVLPTLFHQTSEQLSAHMGYVVLVYALVLPFYVFVHYILHIDYNAIQVANSEMVSNIYRAMNGTMVLFYILVQTSIFIEQQLPKYTFMEAHHRYIIMYCYVFVFLWGILNLNKVSSRTVAITIDDERRKHYHNLAKYNHYLESLYQEIRDFRNKTRRNLLSFEESIESGDKERIRQDFQEYIQNRQNPFPEQKYYLDKLIHLKISPVKSLISAKLLEAQEKGISVTIEIPDVISTLPMKEIDFIIVLSVFLDNAIEAAMDSHGKRIRLAMFMHDEAVNVIIENSSLVEKINLNQIFASGYSTKGHNRGVGLSNVMKIMNRYPNCSLSTKSSNYTVTQHLTIH